MEYSSGIILYDKSGENTKFFVCTPGGPYWEHKEMWNFPKGHIEKDESPFDAALREFEEETSVKLVNDISHYKYLGLVKQNSKKKVHVFIKPYENENLENCYSNLCESIIKGKKYVHPEIKSYKWMTYRDLLEKGIKCYNEIFKSIDDKDN